MKEKNTLYYVLGAVGILFLISYFNKASAAPPPFDPTHPNPNPPASSNPAHAQIQSRITRALTATSEGYGASRPEWHFHNPDNAAQFIYNLAANNIGFTIDGHTVKSEWGTLSQPNVGETYKNFEYPNIAAIVRCPPKEFFCSLGIDPAKFLGKVFKFVSGTGVFS